VLPGSEDLIFPVEQVGHQAADEQLLSVTDLDAGGLIEVVEQVPARASAGAGVGSVHQHGGPGPACAGPHREFGRKVTTMPERMRQRSLKVGDRARNKLNRRIGTIDAVERIRGKRRYGLHYDEEPQDRYLGMVGRDGAQLPPELLERE
jgi:hypothetical protein